MNYKLYQKVIENYVEAYNNFDVDNMLANMNKNVIFENIKDGKTNLTTIGIEELRYQAEQVTLFFKEREQKVTNYNFSDNLVEVDIDYKGILAVDLPNGLKAGDKLELTGKSIFLFEDNKIIEFRDIS